MTSCLNIRLSSVFRLMNELGRVQVTRLIAQTLWEMRGGRENNPRDWYDAERINSDQFWADLNAVNLADTAAAERALQHIFFYREELLRVVIMPSEAPVVYRMQLDPDLIRCGASSDTVLSVAIALEPADVYLGLESDLYLSSPVQVESASAAAVFQSVLNQDDEPCANMVSADTAVLDFKFGGVSFEPQQFTLRADTPLPGLYNLKFDVQGSAELVRKPVDGYPQLPETIERRERAEISGVVLAAIAVS